MTDLATIDATTCGLGEDSSIDDFANAAGMIDAVKARIKEIERLWDDAARAFIEKNGPFILGDKKYVVGTPRKVKCDDMAGGVAALYDKTVGKDGDWDAFVTCLASNAIKQGEAAKVLPPEIWARFFTVSYEPSLEAKSIGKKDLLVMDLRYMK